MPRLKAVASRAAGRGFPLGGRPFDPSDRQVLRLPLVEHRVGKA